MGKMKEESPNNDLPQLPTGTVTFLFTDIQGSTPRWEQEPEQMAAALHIHNAILRKAIEANGGVIFKFVGDEFQAAFPTASQALQAAVEAQLELEAAAWNEVGPLKVRMGLHTGEALLDPGGDEYAVSHTKNRAGRVRSAAYGGQILLSEETADLLKRKLPEGAMLKDMGEHRLKGLNLPEHLYQVCIGELPQDFPALETAITRPNNLPVKMTSFIGREKEVNTVQSLLKGHRLVTLTGAGGSWHFGRGFLCSQRVWFFHPQELGFCSLGGGHHHGAAGSLVYQRAVHGSESASGIFPTLLALLASIFPVGVVGGGHSLETHTPRLAGRHGIYLLLHEWCIFYQPHHHPRRADLRACAAPALGGNDWLGSRLSRHIAQAQGMAARDRLVGRRRRAGSGHSAGCGDCPAIRQVLPLCPGTHCLPDFAVAPGLARCLAENDRGRGVNRALKSVTILGDIPLLNLFQEG